MTVHVNALWIVWIPRMIKGDQPALLCYAVLESDPASRSFVSVVPIRLSWAVVSLWYRVRSTHTDSLPSERAGSAVQLESVSQSLDLENFLGSFMPVSCKPKHPFHQGSIPGFLREACRLTLKPHYVPVIIHHDCAVSYMPASVILDNEKLTV